MDKYNLKIEEYWYKLKMMSEGKSRNDRSLENY